MENNKSSNKDKDSQLIDCFFQCKINKENLEFFGFNKELILFDIHNLDKNIFRNNKIYYFKNLQKKDKYLYYIKDISSFTESDGIIINKDLEKYSNLEPYSLIGKIIKKEKDEILLITSFINEIIIIKDFGNKFVNLYENQYIKISYIRFSSKNDGAIYFKLDQFSLLEILEQDYQENKINQKIALRFNLLDFDSNDLDNKNEIKEILLKQIGIDSPQKYIKFFNTERKTIYYVYDANGYQQEYFPQIIYLYFKDEINPFELKFFVYKSFLTETNLFIRQKCLNVYEFLYFSLDNSLPNYIEIEYQTDKKIKSNDFHTFNSKLRKSIIFINIPVQNKEDSNFDNSFLNIYLCNKEQIKLYGTFCLKTVSTPEKRYFSFDKLIEKNIVGIFNDYFNLVRKGKFEVFKNKYFSLGPITENNLQKELYAEFHLYQYENTENTLNYFNSLCFWNLFYIIIKNKLPFKYAEKYIKVYNKIEERNIFNYIERSMILIDFVQRAFEDKSKFICPKLFFYDELEEHNPYKIAFKFQYEIINNITEESCLFQPFLFLDSYIMDSIQQKNRTDFNKILKPAYSISMLTIDKIKDHLKKTIKNYFFVLKNQGINSRNYYASTKKFTNLITYNETILLCNSHYDKMYQIEQIDLINNKKIINNYAFVLNLENLHENFAHNKELIINLKKSPTLYFDRNLNLGYIYHYKTQEYGESGRLIEAFICGENLIDEIKKNIYEMGDFLKVKYYIGKDFKDLTDGFKNLIKKMQEGETNKFKFINTIKSSSMDTNEITNNLGEKEEKNKSSVKEKISNKEKSLLISQKNSNSQNSNDNELIEEEIILSRHNTYILSAETYEKLLEKIEQMEKKKIIQDKNPIEDNTDSCCY